jgi:hypothetical protein
MDDRVTSLDDHRRKTVQVALMELPERLPPPQGPFTVTVSGADGKLFEAIFPDHTGILPPSTTVLGTTQCGGVLANLLAGALRTFLGEP